MIVLEVSSKMFQQIISEKLIIIYPNFLIEQNKKIKSYDEFKNQDDFDYFKIIFNSNIKIQPIYFFNEYSSKIISKDLSLKNECKSNIILVSNGISYACGIQNVIITNKACLNFMISEIVKQDYNQKLAKKTFRLSDNHYLVNAFGSSNIHDTTNKTLNNNKKNIDNPYINIGVTKNAFNFIKNNNLIILSPKFVFNKVTNQISPYLHKKNITYIHNKNLEFIYFVDPYYKNKIKKIKSRDRTFLYNICNKKIRIYFEEKCYICHIYSFSIQKEYLVFRIKNLWKVSVFSKIDYVIDNHYKFHDLKIEEQRKKENKKTLKTNNKKNKSKKQIKLKLTPPKVKPKINKKILPREGTLTKSYLSTEKNDINIYLNKSQIENEQDAANMHKNIMLENNKVYIFIDDTPLKTLQLIEGGYNHVTRKHSIENKKATIVCFKNNTKRIYTILLHYCNNCKKYFDFKISFLNQIRPYNIDTKNFFLDLEDEMGNPVYIEPDTYEFNEMSLLSILGYKVGYTGIINNEERQKILKQIIDNEFMGIADIKNHLKFNIQFCGKRANMDLAVSHWKNDLNFINNYKKSKL